MRQLLLPLLIALLPLTLAGCGASGSAKDSEQTIAISFLDSIDDLKETRSFANYFVKGSAPAPQEMARYRSYQFRPASKPKLSGDKATVSMTILDGRTEQEIAVKEWTLAKDGDQWKLESAPLP
jgi:hypothetical protein